MMLRKERILKVQMRKRREMIAAAAKVAAVVTIAALRVMKVKAINI